MTKSDLIDVLCETQKLPKGRAELLVHVIFDALEAALKRGERIEIRGFGSFELRSYRGYDGRNPRTGSAVAVRPKRLPFFKVGKELKERVDAGRTTAPRAGAKRAPITDGDRGRGAGDDERHRERPRRCRRANGRRDRPRAGQRARATARRRLFLPLPLDAALRERVRGEGKPLSGDVRPTATRRACR